MVVSFDEKKKILCCLTGILYIFNNCLFPLMNDHCISCSMLFLKKKKKRKKNLMIPSINGQIIEITRRSIRTHFQLARPHHRTRLQKDSGSTHYYYYYRYTGRYTFSKPIPNPHPEVQK